jgi:uncharacterized protein (DUF1499 family)
VRSAFLALLAVGELYALVLGVLALFSQRPRPVGLVGGRLRPCPRPTNCVSTAEPRRRPLAPLVFTGSPEAAMARLAAVLDGMPGCRVVRLEGPYLHAEARSRLFRFVDDVEALADPQAGVIHLRSASRVGVSDRGVNRRRVEEIQRRFAVGG